MISQQLFFGLINVCGALGTLFSQMNGARHRDCIKGLEWGQNVHVTE